MGGGRRESAKLSRFALRGARSAKMVALGCATGTVVARVCVSEGSQVPLRLLALSSSVVCGPEPAWAQWTVVGSGVVYTAASAGSDFFLGLRLRDAPVAVEQPWGNHGTAGSDRKQQK